MPLGLVDLVLGAWQIVPIQPRSNGLGSVELVHTSFDIPGVDECLHQPEFAGGGFALPWLGRDWIGITGHIS